MSFHIQNRIELSKSNISLSPKQEKKLKGIKKDEKVSKDLLENTRKFIEMSNGNNNYIISPLSPKNELDLKYTTPTIEEELSITKKYMEPYEYNSYASNFIEDEIGNLNGNEKLHRVKDEYIEYLQRQLDENNKNVIRLESKLNELQKKFKNLLDDNRNLSETLNDKSSKLNEFIQENENLRLQINNYIDNETKYKLQIQYYEKQIGLYEKNINDYNYIINDLKMSNEKLSNNLADDLDIIKNKDNNNESKINTNNNYNNINYINVKNINNNDGEMKLIKNQNMIFANDIKSKDYMIELVTKKNNKLLAENKIYKTQIQQYAQQISNLYNILKQKNKIISIYRQKEGFTDSSLDIEFEKKLEELNLNMMSNNGLLLNISKDDDIITTSYKYDYTNYNNNINNINNNKLTPLIFDTTKNEKKSNVPNKNIKSLNLVENKNIKIINDTNNNSNKIKINKGNNRSPTKIENGEISIKNGNTWRFLVSPKKKEKKENLKVVDLVTKNIIKEEKKMEQKKEEKNDKNKNGNNNNKKQIKFAGVLDEQNEIKDAVREMNRKKNYSHVPKVKKKFKISDLLDITEINTSSPVAPQNLSFSRDDTDYIKKLISGNNSNSIYLFGIDRDDYFYIFDLKDKKLTKKKILEIEDISDTFSKDYQYEGTILYNTLEGIFILTGKNTDILYYYNSKYDTINKLCKLNNKHDNGSLLLDKENNRLFILGGKETMKCEYYSFADKKLYSLPDLNIDRANAAFIICNNKIYGFFGFSYKNNKYCGSIEFIDNRRLDKWNELKNVKILNENINFEVESISTINYAEDDNKILLYAGIQGDNEDYISDSYYLFDTKDNSIDLIEKWYSKIMKYVSSRWRNSNLTKKDPSGYHFAKNSNFLKLSKNINIEGYEDDIYLLMDYKNNVHFINQEQKTIDIYKSEI